MAHALPHALSARDCLTRCTSQGLCHTRHTHATHPRPHSTHALRATTPRKELRTRTTHTLRILALRATTPRKELRTRTTHTLRTHALTAHTPSVLPPPSQGLCHTHAPRAKCCNAFPCSPSFLRRKREPHNNQNITYYNITCNVYPNRSKDYTKKRGNLFLYRLNLLSLHDES